MELVSILSNKIIRIGIDLININVFVTKYSVVCKGYDEMELDIFLTFNPISSNL